MSKSEKRDLMPHQNRVTPTGEIIATNARGTVMGNRGILHNERQEIIRPYKLKAWIICRLKFKERKRVIMSPGRYTELFFLDEATALAAGHRPCFECQRDRAQAFQRAWSVANPASADGSKTPLPIIDKILHEERLTKARYLKDRRKRTYMAELDDLPDGAFITIEETPYLLWDGRLFPWTPSGYGTPQPRPSNRQVITLTPPSTVATLASGFHPIIHTKLTEH